jgi:hypothetical protein
MLLVAVLAASGIASASVPASPILRTSTVRGNLYTVSCMSTSLCLTGGQSSAQGLPAQLELIRSGRVSKTWSLTKFQGPPSVSCATARACYAISRNATSTDIVRVTSAGQVTQTVLRPGGRVKPVFNSISCVSATRCELAGQSIEAGIATASWNGQRLGAVHSVNVPDNSGFGNYLPEISCSGAWCEEGADLYAPGEQEQDIYALYLTTLQNGTPVSSHWVTGFQGTVACGSPSICYALLDSSTDEGSPAIARVTHGSVATPTPVDTSGFTIACRGQTCMTAGGSTLAFFSSGHETAHRQVPSARAFNGVNAGGSVFSAVGAGRTTGSVLTIAR